MLETLTEKMKMPNALPGAVDDYSLRELGVIIGKNEGVQKALPSNIHFAFGGLHHGK